MKLDKILADHKKFLCGEEGGICANLRGAYLSGADLSFTILSNANLRDAYLRGADLSFTNLSNALINFANLMGANLSNACYS